MKILFLVQVKILVPIKWLYKCPNYADLLSLEWLPYFAHTI